AHRRLLRPLRAVAGRAQRPRGGGDRRAARVDDDRGRAAQRRARRDPVRELGRGDRPVEVVRAERRPARRRAPDAADPGLRPRQLAARVHARGGGRQDGADDHDERHGGAGRGHRRARHGGGVVRQLHGGARAAAGGRARRRRRERALLGHGPPLLARGRGLRRALRLGRRARPRRRDGQRRRARVDAAARPLRRPHRRRVRRHDARPPARGRRLSRRPQGVRHDRRLPGGADLPRAPDHQARPRPGAV
ncbi:MAG: Probable 2-phosphosulfolactate phosphatase, partial [uncultured Gemmatimonadaceae bacterium]